MSRLVTAGKALVGIGLLVILVNWIGGPGAPGGPEAALALVVGGSILLVATRFGVSMPGVQRRLSLDRQDVVSPTDWSRIGKYTLRSSFGTALAAAGGVLFVVSLILQDFGMAAAWAFVTLAGLVLQVVSWRFAHEIAADHTRTLSVRVPDLFSVHSFHVALRQQAEDLGYRVVENASPAESGSKSPIDESVLHSKGGFKARRRPVGETKSLAPEIDDPYLDRILTVTTLGVFTLLLGVMVFSVGDRVDQSVPLLGLPLALIGIGVIGYDYVTRTREWGELYCVEEGTVYASTINEYDDDVLESPNRGPEPTVSSSATGAVLSVTVGAKCTALYDEEELAEDFEELVGAIEGASEEFRQRAVDPVDAPAGEAEFTHTEP